MTFSNTYGKIFFSQKQDQLISLERSPFGGFVVDETASEENLEELVRQVLKWCQTRNVKSIIIRCFPEAYNIHLSKLSNEVLLRNMFAVKYHDISQMLMISEDGPMMNVHRQRRLRKCKAEGYVFEKLPPSFLPEAYACIAESRNDKGYPITMTLPELSEMFDRFPDHYYLFGVKDQAKIVATCVAIEVSPKILYCFYIGDALAYRHTSPVTMLMDGLYKFAREHHYELIDLGISTDEGVLNEGLYSFKKSLGAVDSPKLTFTKQF